MNDQEKRNIYKRDYPLNWQEDLDRENGDYMNRCSKCNNMFRGHKRRTLCKKCNPPKGDEVYIPGVSEAALDALSKGNEAFDAYKKQIRIEKSANQLLDALRELEYSCRDIQEVSGGTQAHQRMWIAQLAARDAITEATGITWRDKQDD
jgi:hypothetical protein